MNRIKSFSLLTILTLLLTACAGYELRPATSPTATAAAPAATATLAPTRPPTAAPTVTATPEGAWISLSPDHGKPGDTIQVEGYIPTPPSGLGSGNTQVYTNLCWGGCTDGMQEQGIQGEWSQTDPGHFSLSFVVPSTPWLAADGPHNLVAGDYPVSIEYMDFGSTACADPTAKGCMVVINTAQPFHLDQGISAHTCSQQDCGSLAVSPTSGSAGSTIQVTGWAPLLEMIGTGPSGYSGYSLMLLPSGSASQQDNLLNGGASVSQGVDGSLAASFQVPLSTQNGPLPAGTYTLGLNAESLANAKATKGSIPQPELVATTTFEVTAAPAWSQLQSGQPLWIQPASSLLSPTIGFDPANPSRLAYCTTGAIKVSTDGGASWTSISTDAVGPLADAMGFTTGYQQQQAPACNAVVLDPTHPQSYYAIFGAASKQYGAPPTYYLGFYTTDDGQTWKAAPTPPESGNVPMIQRFGGFWNDGNNVQAFYSGDSSGQPGEAAPTLVEQTSDGGATWAAGTLTCQASGPCLSWGAAPGAISGMGASLPQFVMASQDGGQTWTSTGQFVELHMNGPQELAALSSNEAVLISGGVIYPLLVTLDGGKTWQAYTLPTLPGASQSTGFQYNGLQMMPDGSLVAMSVDSGAWYALVPGSQDWCQVKATVPGNFPALFQMAGNTAWWFSPTDQAIHSLPLSDFACK